MEDRRVKQEVKQETVEYSLASPENRVDDSFLRPISIDFSGSSNPGDGGGTVAGGKRDRVSIGLDGVLPKKTKLDGLGTVSVGSVAAAEPPIITSSTPTPVSQPSSTANTESRSIVDRSCKLFWKAGDYEGASDGDSGSNTGGLDHVRVHPKFLHSNATSHKWALGAFAELLDNSLDEICHGATYVNVDILENKKDGSRMLLIEDNGGGMNPEIMRQCMSLGYSVKSKMANTIGQYGNGFKTSTMRLGADVIVFSRCCGKNGRSPTQSIGLLSFTFLRSTGKEDIVVPMIDYEKRGQEWNKMIRYTGDWNKNVETIVQWSPFSSESDLFRQFNFLQDHGTRIIIYNLWEDDSGQLELDFDTDQDDIQIRGVNRDEKNIKMANQFPNSKHFLTYRHSLRSYASILYLRIPLGFRIILRGKDIDHHNVVNDMMMTQEVTYRPQAGGDGVPKDSNMVAVVTVGFVKDARHHIDVQGFNVYHKNRLIKPFWRLWNAAGSDGRGVIGVLEANFVEPAHDKQGFERTIVLSRLEARLQQMQKTYWTTYCHKIGYAPRRNKKSAIESTGEDSDDVPNTSSQPKTKVGGTSNKTPNDVPKTCSQPKTKVGAPISKTTPQASHSNQKQQKEGEFKRTPEIFDHGDGNGNGQSTSKQENRTNMPIRDGKDQSSSYSELTERFERHEDYMVIALRHDLEKEREKRKLLETELQKAKRTIKEMTEEQDNLIDIFSEERERRTNEEENLRNKLKEASITIQELLMKVKQVEE